MTGMIEFWVEASNKNGSAERYKKFKLPSLPRRKELFEFDSAWASYARVLGVYHYADHLHPHHEIEIEVDEMAFDGLTEEKGWFSEKKFP